MMVACNWNRTTAGCVKHQVSRCMARKKHHFIFFPWGRGHMWDQTSIHWSYIFHQCGRCNILHTYIHSFPAGANAKTIIKKMIFFIECQAVCDIWPCITNFVCRWLDSTHDCRFYENLTLCFKFESDCRLLMACCQVTVVVQAESTSWHFFETLSVTHKEKYYSQAWLAT